MDSQVPEGYPDIFGLLSKRSLAKLKAVKSEAVAELLPALSHTIESIAVNMDGLREHDPSVFFPAFERCVESQYDGYAEELLPHFSDVARCVWHLETDVTDRISDATRPKPEFVRNNGFLGEWAESLRDRKESELLVQDSAPNGRREADIDLSVSSGEWETYIERCFLRHLLKHPVLSQRVGDPEFEEREQISVIFRLKYKFYFRRWTNWLGFDTYLRAHLSNRLAHWKAEADLRAVLEVDDVAVPKLVPPLVLSKSGTERRDAIDGFIVKMTDAGRKITRKEIWTVAGYKDPTEFQRFQRADFHATKISTTNFTRVLCMKPEDFFSILDNKVSK